MARLQNKKILISLTTMSNWKAKLKEISKLKIKEIAVFMTGISKEEKKEFYKLLKKSPVISIPHVHIKTDTTPKELEFFINNYKTKVFNLHSTKEFPLVYQYKKYRKIIFLENTRILPNNKELNEFAGLCLDFSHWETRGSKNFRNKLKRKAEMFKIGCSHISAVDPIKKDDDHFLENLSELNYMKEYKKYLPDLMSIELENPIKEQIKIKKYLKKILELK